MRYNTTTFINKAKQLHNKKYDYSETKYVNMSTQIVIICPIHGRFMQRSDTHVNRKANCPKCAYSQRAITRREVGGWLPFAEARNVIRNHKFSSISDWNRFCSEGRRPDNIPASPKITYKEEWNGWEDWIGVNGRTREFLEYKEAQMVVCKFNIRSYEDWLSFCKKGNRPKNIPFAPLIMFILNGPTGESGWA